MTAASGGFKREGSRLLIDWMHLKTCEKFAQNALFLHKILQSFFGKEHSPFTKPYFLSFHPHLIPYFCIRH